VKSPKGWPGTPFFVRRRERPRGSAAIGCRCFRNLPQQGRTNKNQRKEDCGSWLRRGLMKWAVLSRAIRRNHSFGTDAKLSHSVFAIHGLGGDKFGTWTENGKLWLRDFLPTRLPEARIFTYGYNSVVAFSKSAAQVDDFARDFLHRVQLHRKSEQERSRPMVFICHSLGGILFKQACD